MLANNKVPARTRCAAGATWSSGSSCGATTPSSHHRRIARGEQAGSANICTVVGAARGGPNLACAQGGSGFSDSLPDARTRTRRRLAVGAQLARLLASAAGAGCESVRRRVVSGGAGRSVAVQPGPGGRPDGHRGGLRGAVSALFAAGALRRGPNGPVGSAVGAGWRQHRPASPDRRGRHDTRGRSRRRAAVGRSAGRQRRHDSSPRDCRRHCPTWCRANRWSR